jgi:hypothetical protein
MGIEALQAVLKDQFRRYPQMQVRDLYKLLHQAALGSEHAVQDEHAVRVWMGRELADMGAGPDEPLPDPISPDGAILRVHLRPYIISGRNPDRLLRSFIQTANEWHGQPSTLKEYMEYTLAVAEQGLLSLAAAEIAAFFYEMESKGFIAAHHSDVYEHLYRPAYRVVAKDFMEEI